MAAANLITTGTGAQNSADITVTTTPVVVALKDAAQGALVHIYLKDEAGGWQWLGSLDVGQPSRTLGGAGVYRATRPAGSASCGVFSG